MLARQATENEFQRQQQILNMFDQANSRIGEPPTAVKKAATEKRATDDPLRDPIGIDE